MSESQKPKQPQQKRPGKRISIDIPKEKRIAVAIAVGCPNPAFPANQLQSVREPVEKFNDWYGFAEIQVVAKCES